MANAPVIQPQRNAKSLELLLSKEELRDALNLPSTRMVDQLVKARKIPFFRLGHRTVRFHLERVMDALARLEVHAIGDSKGTRPSHHAGNKSA